MFGRLFGNPLFRAIFFQVLVVGSVVGLSWFLISNTLDNLERRSIATGFAFLSREAAFGIGESLIPYGAENTYARAVLVGLLNTIKVTLIAMVLSGLVGLVVGIARLSTNWLLCKLAAIYVEVARNVPVLLQLFLWYAIITESLPGPRQALEPVPGVFLSNRGLVYAVPADHPGWWLALGGLVLAFVVSGGVRRWARERQARTGQPFATGRTTAALFLALPLLGWLAGGGPLAMDVPVLVGFNFRGGAMISPELASLLLGLTIYTSGFIAEIVRSGILSVSNGQTEAGLSLGLSRGQVMRLVILPQALRVMIPPLGGEYLKLSKNTSLAVAVGYPDLVSVANTIINQTGQAIEGVALIMGAFLLMSLALTLFLNWYNRRVALVER